MERSLLQDQAGEEGLATARIRVYHSGNTLKTHMTLRYTWTANENGDILLSSLNTTNKKRYRLGSAHMPTKVSIRKAIRKPTLSKQPAS